MVVPLNLSWGTKFRAARQVVAERFGNVWASTYDIIPGRLFEGVSIRNTIVLGGPGSEPGRVHTAMFAKWVPDYRPYLMETRFYATHTDTPHVWPKCGHSGLFPLANARRGKFGLTASRKPTQFRVGHKKIARYWLSVFIEDPPALDASRMPMPQKVVGDMYFGSQQEQMAALAISASRLMVLWWIMTGDIFNVKTQTFLEFPVGLHDVSPQHVDRLVEVGRQLHARFQADGDHLLWTPQAGEWYGNFDLNRCRDLTDEADAVLLEHLNLVSVREDFEAEYHNYMKSGGDRPGTVRGGPPDRDR
jgi:hypothetical protein